MGRKEQVLVTLTQAIATLRETKFSEPLKFSLLLFSLLALLLLILRRALKKKPPR